MLHSMSCMFSIRLSKNYLYASDSRSMPIKFMKAANELDMHVDSNSSSGPLTPIGGGAMSCYQCEQTLNRKACTEVGVCGKTPAVSALQVGFVVLWIGKH